MKGYIRQPIAAFLTTDCCGGGALWQQPAHTQCVRQ
jgi:hypothetical protein